MLHCILKNKQSIRTLSSTSPSATIIRLTAMVLRYRIIATYDGS